MWRIFLNCCAHKPLKRHAISSIVDKLSDISWQRMVRSSYVHGRLVSSIGRPRNSSLGNPVTQTPELSLNSVSNRSLSLPIRPKTEDWPPITHFPPQDEPNEDAKRISDHIDEEIRQEAAQRGQQFRQRRDEIRVILLGQSGSGKSTTLRRQCVKCSYLTDTNAVRAEFQLASTPRAFEDRLAWRLVIYLNIIRSVRRIFQVSEFFEARADDLLAPSPLTSDIPRLHDLYPQLSPLWDLEGHLLKLLGGEAHREATKLESSDSFGITSTSTSGDMAQGSNLEGFGKPRIERL